MNNHFSSGVASNGITGSIPVSQIKIVKPFGAQNKALSSSYHEPRSFSKKSRRLSCPFSRSCGAVQQSSSSSSSGSQRQQRRGSMRNTTNCKLFDVSPTRMDSNIDSRTIVQVAQRSNSKFVKKTIASISSTCRDYKNCRHNNDSKSIEAPHQECEALAKLSSDAYYMVIISKHGGMGAIVDAMNTFPKNEHVQINCCIILSHLSSFPEPHRGSVVAIMNAMKNFPESFALQSAGCDALRSVANSTSVVDKHCETLQFPLKQKDVMSLPAFSQQRITKLGGVGRELKLVA